MRVQVRVVCLPHPQQDVEAALRSAGQQLTLNPDTASVRITPTQPRVAILDFDMRRAPQYKAVDQIYATVKRYTWAFREDITIEFPKSP